MIKELNNYFKNEIRIHQILKQEPILVDDGFYQSHPLLKHNSKLIEKELKTNDLHGVLINDLAFSPDPTILKFKKIHFSEIVALRQLGERPHELTANVIAIDSDKKTIILHQRSIKSHLYPGTLSIVGGGFLPQDELNSNDRLSLKLTAIREFHEETQLNILTTNDTKLLLTEELTTGAIQLNYLGVTVHTDFNDAINAEGEVKFVAFNQLNALLEENNNIKWAPLGKCCVLAWLALGAPGTIHEKFNGVSAVNLYRKLIS